MMSSRLWLVVLVATVVGFSSAAEILCPSDYCNAQNCLSVQEVEANCHDGVVREHASFCQCCPVCMKQLKEGDVCLHPMEAPPTAECGEGLTCMNSTCKTT